MAFPFLPVALVGAGVAAVAAALFALKKPTSSDTGVEELPQKLQQPFLDLLAKGSDPDSLDAVAVKLESFGFAKQGAALRKRSAVLRGGPLPGAQPAAPGPGPGNIPAQPQAQPANPQPQQPSTPKPAPAPTASFARVTTNDPAPAGDLSVFADSAGTKKIGGAEKGSLVTVLAPPAPGALTARVHASNPGGRYPGVDGFVHAKFLVPTNPSATAGLTPQLVGSTWHRGTAVGALFEQARSRSAVVGSSKQAVVGSRGGSPRRVAIGARSVPGTSGRASTPSSPVDVQNHCGSPLRLFRQPTRTAKPTGATFEAGEWGKLLQAVSGPKTSEASPGAGGWAHVSVGPRQDQQGWVLLEWLGADVTKKRSAA